MRNLKGTSYEERNSRGTCEGIVRTDEKRMRRGTGKELASEERVRSPRTLVEELVRSLRKTCEDLARAFRRARQGTWQLACEGLGRGLPGACGSPVRIQLPGPWALGHEKRYGRIRAHHSVSAMASGCAQLNAQLAQVFLLELPGNFCQISCQGPRRTL